MRNIRIMRNIRKVFIALLVTCTCTCYAQITANALDRGFIHPGGLHSKQDFDRIRRQVSENEPTVKKAYDALIAWGKSNKDTGAGATEEIVRGKTNNTGNAAHRVKLAYKYALLYNLTNETKYADIAINILNTWAKVCKRVTGDTNAALAYGLQGFQFAQVGELMRDYAGWSRDDFEAYRKWMLRVFYSGNQYFLYVRNGMNPGGYFSNWGLANAMSMISIGILCDDVYIYNQGVSFIKYDMVPENNQCKNYRHDTWWDYTKAPYKDYPAIQEDAEGNFRDNGYNEYIGNLVMALHEDKRGVDIYGNGSLWLGRMQELGRDQGHNVMSVGVIADICQTGWNQGDDIWGWMGNRLAAGIECTALYNYDKECDVPYKKYHYRYDNSAGNYSDYTVSYASSASRGHNRPIWNRIVSHYEGIKGIKMNYSRLLAESDNSDLDEFTGVDHFGLTKLTSIIPARNDGKRPIYLEPYIEINGERIHRSSINNIAIGSTITMIAQIPDNAVSGTWKWNMGNDTDAKPSSTNTLTINPKKSNIYRVTYKAVDGTTSTQLFGIAVSGDCYPDPIKKYFYVSNQEQKEYDGWKSDAQATIYKGSQTTLSCQAGSNTGKWRYFVKDEHNVTFDVSSPFTIDNDTTIYVEYINDGGAVSHDSIRFITVKEGQKIIAHKNQVYEGDYYLQKKGTSLFWTNSKVVGNGISPVLEEKRMDDATQIWTLTLDEGQYKLVSKYDGRYINEKAQFHTNAYSPEWNTYNIYTDDDMNAAFQITGLAATGSKWSLGDSYFWYWNNGFLTVDKSHNTIRNYDDFIFTLIPVDITLGIKNIKSNDDNVIVYDLQGRRMDISYSRKKGIYIKNGKKIIIR